MRKQKPRWVRDIARDFIVRHLKLAEEAYKTDRKLAHRYIELAIKASRKYNVRIPKEYKKRICPKCHALMIPGFNATIRVSRGYVLWVCGECGHVRRFGYVKEKGKADKATGASGEKRTNNRGYTGGKKAPGKI